MRHWQYVAAETKRMRERMSIHVNTRNFIKKTHGCLSSNSCDAKFLPRPSLVLGM